VGSEPGVAPERPVRRAPALAFPMGLVSLPHHARRRRRGLPQGQSKLHGRRRASSHAMRSPGVVGLAPVVATAPSWSKHAPLVSSASRRAATVFNAVAAAGATSPPARWRDRRARPRRSPRRPRRAPPHRSAPPARRRCRDRAFRENAVPAAIEEDDLQARASLADKDKEGARARLVADTLAHPTRQPLEAVAHVDRLERNEYLHPSPAVASTPRRSNRAPPQRDASPWPTLGCPLKE
jgi:hypothetical protein